MKKMHRQRLLLETIALILVLFIQRAASKYTDRYYEVGITVLADFMQFVSFVDLKIKDMLR